MLFINELKNDARQYGKEGDKKSIFITRSIRQQIETIADECNEQVGLKEESA